MAVSEVFLPLRPVLSADSWRPAAGCTVQPGCRGAGWHTAASAASGPGPSSKLLITPREAESGQVSMPGPQWSTASGPSFCPLFPEPSAPLATLSTSILRHKPWLPTGLLSPGLMSSRQLALPAGPLEPPAWLGYGTDL